MPKFLTQYRVFIGSPGGLEDERNRFREKLEKYTVIHAEPRGVTFHPVGWEDTIGGVGRPQELINEDLRQCDYAVFVLHDHWGSPTGSGYSSGTEEEWELAEKLYDETKIRNIALFFKQIDPRQLRDPGEQATRVIGFKRQIEASKKYLFKAYGKTEDFCEELEKHLAKWLRDHEGAATGPSSGGLAAIAPPDKKTDATPTATTPPDHPAFDYWISEATSLLAADPAETRNYSGALFCAERASATAGSDMEWAWAKSWLGTAQFHLNRPTEAIAAFTEIVERFAFAGDTNSRGWGASALVNKGFMLGHLGRSAEEIAVYDDVLLRFGTASELPLRESVARALSNKGVTLGKLGRRPEEIAVYDDMLARFGTASELILREPLARALFNKGFSLYQLGRREEAIAVYEDMVARFGTASELALRESVAKALFNKGWTLGVLDRSAEEIAVYDDVLARYGTASELSLREQVAKALVNKGFALGQLGQSEEAIAVYDDVLARFGTASELPLREQVAKALVNKGVTLAQLGRREEAIKVYDDVVARFNAAEEPSLKKIVELARGLRGNAKPM
jgi:tetratricopeptide (TPR) repeat protein